MSVNAEGKVNNHNRTVLFYPVLLQILICASLFLGILFLHYNNPVAYIYLIAEDSWGEYGTFACYMVAGLLIAGAIKSDRQLMRPGYILLFLGLLFVGMEEISWGQRLLGIQTPYIIARYNYQSELTLHNLPIFPKVSIFYHAVLIWALFLPLISRKYQRARNYFTEIGIPLVPVELLPYFVLSLFFLNIGVVITNSEVGEIILSLAFLLLAVDIFYKALNDAKRVVWAKGWIRCLSIAVALTAMLILTLARPDVSALKFRLNKWAIEKYPERSLYAQAQKIFRYIIEHKEFKNNDTLFQYGLFLRSISSQEAEAVFLKALEESKEHVQLNPEKPTPNLIAGKIYKQLGQLDLAEKEFWEALRKDQARLAQAKLDWQRTDALKSMGETYIEMGKHELAREHLQKAFDYAEDGWTKSTIKNLLKTITVQ